MRDTMKLLLCAAILLVPLSTLHAIPWMFQPTNEAHAQSNNYCEFQNYGGAPYYHDGIDVIKSTGGVPVYSVSDGWMTHESYGTMYGGLMIGDEYAAGATGWLYWHLPSSTYPFNVGDLIYEGDYIGDIAYWSVYNFHHCHFNRVVGTGGLPWSWYESIDNPIEWLEPTTDIQPPVIHPALGTNLLAFCVNNTSNYLNSANLSGDVDIISKIGDLAGTNRWEIIPTRIEYTISGGAVDDHRLAFVFNDALPASNTINTVYKDDATCNTEGNYTARDFFFILTNNDGDSTIEVSDNAGMWHTVGYPGGIYTITVDAYDGGGNLTQASMDVNVAAAPTYDVTLTMTPTSSLNLPETGGSFTFTVEIHNNEAVSVNFDAWIEMTYPNGDVVLVLLRSLNLAAGGTIMRDMTQTIAGSEPNGTYSYDGKLGYYPYNDWATNGFTFTKGLAGSSPGAWTGETTLSGWDEPANPFQNAVQISKDFALVGIYPNPLNPVATLSYSLPEGAFTSLKVYNLSGQVVTRLVEGWNEAGPHAITFDGSNLPSGIYLYHLKVGDQNAMGKLILMK